MGIMGASSRTIHTYILSVDWLLVLASRDDDDVSTVGGTHHSILGTLDALVNDLPPGALQRTDKVAVVRAIAYDLLERQVAVGEDGLLQAGALGRGGDGGQVVDGGRRGIAVGAAAVRRAVAGAGIARGRGAALEVATLLRDERRLVEAPGGAEGVSGLETAQGAVRPRRRGRLQVGYMMGGGDGRGRLLLDRGRRGGGRCWG